MDTTFCKWSPNRPISRLVEILGAEEQSVIRLILVFGIPPSPYSVPQALGKILYWSREKACTP